MSFLSVLGDQSSHGGGGILEGTVAGSVFVESIPAVIIISESVTFAGADSLCDSNNHCAGVKSGPSAGSSTIFVEGFPVHRVGDLRGCTATTGIEGVGINKTVFGDTVEI